MRRAVELTFLNTVPSSVVRVMVHSLMYRLDDNGGYYFLMNNVYKLLYVFLMHCGLSCWRFIMLCFFYNLIIFSCTTVGDLMQSMVLLLYKPEEGQLEERAKHYQPNWMTAVSVLDDDVFLGAENNCNLFAVKRNSDSAVEEEQARLAVQCFVK